MRCIKARVANRDRPRLAGWIGPLAQFPFRELVSRRDASKSGRAARDPEREFCTTIYNGRSACAAVASNRREIARYRKRLANLLCCCLW